MKIKNEKEAIVINEIWKMLSSILKNNNITVFDQIKTPLLFVYHFHMLGRVITLFQKGFLNRNRTMQ